MILTFVGKVKEKNLKELKNLSKNPNIHNKTNINLELNKRINDIKND